MKCQNCGQELAIGADFCGNCGQPVPAQAAPQPAQTYQQPAPAAPAPDVAAPVEQPVQSVGQPLQPPQPVYQPEASAPAYQPLQAATPTGMPGPAYALSQAPTLPGGGKAIAALVLGIIALIAWLIPIAGLIIGVLAIVFGTMSTRSAHRGLAIAGIVLGSVGILLSLFMFVYALNVLSKKKAETSSSQNSSVTTPATGASADLQALTTTCFGTRIEPGFTVNNTPGSCSSTGSATASGESFFIKSIVARSTTSDAQFTALVKDDFKNVVNAIPDGYIVSEGPSRFSGSPAYSFVVGVKNGYGSGSVSYVRHDSGGYNLFILGRFSDNSKTSLDTLETNWSWK